MINKLQEQFLEVWPLLPTLGRWLLILCGCIIIALAGLTLALLVLPGERLWSVKTLDLVVRIGLMILGILGIGWLASTLPFLDRQVRRQLRPAMRIGAALLVVLTFFAGYSSFRNQGRLSSEAALGAGGYHLYNIEMGKEEIRCVYFNYGYHDASECRESLVKDMHAWTFAIYYVEEAWFQLAQAKREQDEWGATYAEQVKYWAQDVSRDPTGIFSYYLVSSEPSRRKVRETMADSGVSIADPCLGFQFIWSALERRKKLPTAVSGAAKECAAERPRLSSVLQRPTLPIPDE